jgi:MFS family permease
VLSQLTDLAFPLSFYEQAPLVGAGIPALTLTTGTDAATPDFGDSPTELTAPHMGPLGRAAQSLLAALEQGVEFERSTASGVYLGGGRVLGGWSIQLVLMAALLPFFAAVVDLFARCRRRRIRLSPAVLSYGRRLAFWLVLGAAFAVFGALGAWPAGDPHPPAPSNDAVTDWPLAALAGLAVVAGGAWLVAREGLLPRGPVSDEDELGGYTAALLVLGVLSLVVVALNAYALLLLLPSLHSWLWLPHVRLQRPWVRAGVLAAGYAGPVFLLASLAGRFGLGADAPWYLLTLVAIGYVGPASVVVALAWAAAAAQLTAAVVHRYAPAPTASERARRRTVPRRIARSLAGRRRGRASGDDLAAPDDVAADG